MGWRKYLLIPRLSWLAARAPRDQHIAWARYWSGVSRTGNTGDVLWDSDDGTETTAVIRRLSAHADLSLPLVDLGCGNGRQAREFTRHAPAVIGIDGFAAALEHARAELAQVQANGHGPGPGTLTFRLGDATDPELGAALRAELGDVNVHIRGLLHVVEPKDRPVVVANLARMLGSRGVLYLVETDVAGDPLDYLVSQGATPLQMPAPLQRLVSSGLRPPSHFGAAELARYFPADDGWRVHESGPTDIHGIPRRPGEPSARIPGFFGVLSRPT